MMSQLLPPNATALELALADFTQKKLTGLAIPIRDLWSPWRCPLPLLPWLAWAVSVDEWDASWSELQKRETIASSFKVHAKKGTRLAVEQRLNSLGYKTAITEWHQNKKVMPPYTFWADIDVGSKPVTSNIFNSANELIHSSKNTRSHLTRLRIGTDLSLPVHAASATYSGVYCAIGGDLEVIQTPADAGIDYVYASSSIYPMYIQEVVDSGVSLEGSGYLISGNFDELSSGLSFSGSGDLKSVLRNESVFDIDELSVGLSFSGVGKSTVVKREYSIFDVDSLDAGLAFSGSGILENTFLDPVNFDFSDDELSCGLVFSGIGVLERL